RVVTESDRVLAEVVVHAAVELVAEQERRRVGRAGGVLTDQRRVRDGRLQRAPKLPPPGMVDLLRRVETPSRRAEPEPVLRDRVVAAEEKVLQAGVRGVERRQRRGAGE